MFIRNTTTTITTRIAPSRSAAVRFSSDRSMKSACRNSRCCRSPCPAAGLLNLVERGVQPFASAPACSRPAASGFRARPPASRCATLRRASAPGRSSPPPRRERRPAAFPRRDGDLADVFRRTRAARRPGSGTPVRPRPGTRPKSSGSRCRKRVLDFVQRYRVLAKQVRRDEHLILFLLAARSAPPAPRPALPEFAAAARCRPRCGAPSRNAGRTPASMKRISPMIDEIGARNGGSTLGGSDAETSDSFSVTVCRARWMSWPQSNSTQITATPTAVAERTRRTPGAAVDRGLDRERSPAIPSRSGPSLAPQPESSPLAR